ncbi:MAG: GIY-YIG nuclease family protein [Sphingomonadaceae bacterium]|nr:GIY-YIG nuclease family protein [Sphingomonadaceae bacterium]
MEKAGYVYIMASRPNGTLYIGVTSDLPKRVYEHREGLIPGFTKRYGCKMLVWYQTFDTIEAARTRELQMKEWRRAWKIEAILALNSDWADLFEGLA